MQSAIESIESKEKSGKVPEQNSREEIQEGKRPIFPRNPSFPALHRGLTVKYDRARGRHVVASEHIKCGTYLALEVRDIHPSTVY